VNAKDLERRILQLEARRVGWLPDLHPTDPLSVRLYDDAITRGQMRKATREVTVSAWQHAGQSERAAAVCRVPVSRLMAEWWEALQAAGPEFRRELADAARVVLDRLRREGHLPPES
jgi:hypothetical protein